MIREFALTDLPYLLQAAGVTLMLSFLTFIGGALLGLPVAIMRAARPWLPKLLALAYIQLIQGIPVLLLLFLFYYGLGLFGYRLPTLVAAAIGLVLYASAFLADIWRGAIQSIPRTQWEAADALALTPVQKLSRVIIPQAIRRATPPTVGFMVQIVKNTSIASIIGYVELSRAGQLVNDSTFQPLPVFCTVAAIYFLINFPLSALSRWLERRLHGAG
ncbi:amino acid ABC transporter permease [Bosea sp. NPDC055594]